MCLESLFFFKFNLYLSRKSLFWKCVLAKTASSTVNSFRQKYRQTCKNSCLKEEEGLYHLLSNLPLIISASPTDHLVSFFLLVTSSSVCSRSRVKSYWTGAILTCGWSFAPLIVLAKNPELTGATKVSLILNDDIKRYWRVTFKHITDRGTVLRFFKNQARNDSACH